MWLEKECPDATKLLSSFKSTMPLSSRSGALPSSLTSTGDGTFDCPRDGSGDGAIDGPRDSSGDGMGKGIADGTTNNTWDNPKDNTLDAATDKAHNKDADIGDDVDGGEEAIWNPKSVSFIWFLTAWMCCGHHCVHADFAAMLGPS